eukprot:6782325-Prymnesium_polylepis.1
MQTVACAVAQQELDELEGPHSAAGRRRLWTPDWARIPAAWYWCNTCNFDGRNGGRFTGATAGREHPGSAPPCQPYTHGTLKTTGTPYSRT